MGREEKDINNTDILAIKSYWICHTKSGEGTWGFTFFNMGIEYVLTPIYFVIITELYLVWLSPVILFDAISRATHSMLWTKNWWKLLFFIYSLFSVSAHFPLQPKIKYILKIHFSGLLFTKYLAQGLKVMPMLKWLKPALSLLARRGKIYRLQNRFNCMHLISWIYCLNQ